jgi:hypothetical protein
MIISGFSVLALLTPISWLGFFRSTQIGIMSRPGEAL